MNNIEINGRKVWFSNPDQVISMAGPWVGELFIDDKLITNNVIVDNLIYSKSYNKLFFVKYNHVSGWRRKNYFTINYFDMSNDCIYTADLNLKIVYLKKINNLKSITIYDAFHNQDESKERILAINGWR